MPTVRKNKKKTHTRLPEINLDELKKFKERNFKERLEFLDWYAKWVKNSSNAEWSSAQKSLINIGEPVGKKEYDKIIKELDELRGADLKHRKLVIQGIKELEKERRRDARRGK